MSQKGKRFLSGLLNRVKSSNSESRATQKRRERSLTERRLGMEPLEDRQLLSADPTLLAAFSQAQTQADAVADASTEIQTTTVASAASDSVVTLNVGPVATVPAAEIEETIVSQSTDYCATVGDELYSNAIYSTLDSYYVSADYSAYSGYMTYYGWAAALANVLMYSGWGDTSEIIDPESTLDPEQQIYSYIRNSFTYAPTTMEAAFAWFTNGAAYYEYQDVNNYAHVYEGDEHGGLYPYASGQYDEYTNYVETIDLVKTPISSPIRAVTQQFLNNNYGVGVEVHYANAQGEDIEDAYFNQPKKSWLTFWGYDYDSTYADTDVEYYTAVYMSNPTTGEVERMPIQWDSSLSAYVFTTYDQGTGQRPYIRSFTAIQRMPGYGVLELDAYEPNNATEDFDAGSPADLGVIDVVTPSSQSGVAVYGNVLPLTDLTLFAKSELDQDDASKYDPVDFYKFELTQTASNYDSIVVEWPEGVRTQNLKATLYTCVDNIPEFLDPTAYGYVEGHFDASPTQSVKHTTGADGKVYSTTYNQLTITLAGLDAGEYFLKVEFADDVIGGVNTGYTVTFNAGFDDIYEENNSVESVKEKPVSTEAYPTANLGVLYGTTSLTDLVLKQYSNMIDEVDWYRFEMTAPGAAGDFIRLYANSTDIQINDADLDLYLYIEDSSDPRGYRLVAKSYVEMTNVEQIDLEGLDAGVYYIKVVGNYSAGNVEYKLEIKPGASDVPDLRPTVPGGSGWEAPLVVSTDKFIPNGEETYANDSVIGKDSVIYLNYSFSVNGASKKYGADKDATYEGVKLSMYINGEEVAASDLETLIRENTTLSSDLKSQLIALFCSEDGLDMKANDVITISNLNLGRIVDEGSFANTHFDQSAQATNSIVIVINPDNYELAEGFGTIVDEKIERYMSLVYEDGKFYSGATPVSIAKGETVEVYRNNKYYKEIKYGVDDFDFKNGDVVNVSVVSHNYKVAVDGYYTINDDVVGVKEYDASNNFSSMMFLVTNLSEDAFAPNGSVADVMNNTNEDRYCPDLGYANIDNLTPYDDEDAGDTRYHRVIDNLVVTGETTSNGGYLADWFRFRLKSSDEGSNYDDAFVRIDMDTSYADFGGDDNLGDLDLYLYKVVQADETQSFEEAFEDGAYRLVLIGSSKTVPTVDSEGNPINSDFVRFADIDGIDDGNYFIRVDGFNGSANRYSLTLGGFTAPGEIEPTDPASYFTEDCVTILNSVATIDLNVPVNDYVTGLTIQYREKGTEEWITPDSTKDLKASTRTAKITKLDPDTTYEFKLIVTNSFVADNPPSAIVEKTTAAYLNEVVYRAIIVGVSDYPGQSNDLIAAASDAKAFKNALLKDPQWAEDNIFLFTDAEATKAAVLNKVAEIAQASDDNDVFVFYFAGSGTSVYYGGRRLGYLKTCGTTRSEFISSADLLEAVNSVAAGSKQIILDAGQYQKDDPTTSVVYKPFIDSLTASTTNGDSEKVAQITVLTSGDDTGDNLSPVGLGTRSAFNRALVAAMEEYSKVVTPDEAEADDALVESDGRVAFSELYDYVSTDERVVASEMKIGIATNDSADATIMMNGKWSEAGAFNEAWLDAGAIIVDTAVDVVDAHDGKTSLREAAALVGTTVPRATTLKNGDSFTLKAGSQITVGVTEGALVEDVELVYGNGAFRTAGACAVQMTTAEVPFTRSGVVVTWTEEAWTADQVAILDANGEKLDDLEYQLVATTVVEEGSTEEATSVVLKDGDVLYTALKGGKAVVVKKVGQNYRLYLDDAIYTRTTGLYLDGKLVTISSQTEIEQNITFKKVIFDSSLAGQTLPINGKGGAIVFTKGGVVDASSLKGQFTIDGQGGASLVKASGKALTSLVGLKFTNATGQAFLVSLGSQMEIANSLISGINSGSRSLFLNNGTLFLTNDTIVQNSTSKTLVGGSGEATVVNSIIALNTGDVSNLTNDGTSVISGDATYDPGFVDAANGDFALLKTSEAIDIGLNSAIKTRGGVVLEYDLAGNERVAVAGTIDAGAFEYTVPLEDRETPSTVVTILEDIVDATDNEISLREAIAYAGTAYNVETELEDGAVLTDADGNLYEVKGGKLIKFEGVAGVQSGQYYAIEGVYFVNSLGEPTLLEEGTVVTLNNGTKATVVGTRLLRASGIPVASGATITLEDGASGTLSYGIATDFLRNQRIVVALTPAKIDPSTPVADFDSGNYVLTYQANGTFSATLQKTTTNDQNQTETTTFEANFKLVDGVGFNFVEADSTVGEAGVIVTTRNVELADGRYTLQQDLTDGKGTVLYTAGAVLNLTRGVFTDADGVVVDVPAGTKFTAPDGSKVEYRASRFTPATLEAGTELTDEDGNVRKYKDGVTLFDEVTLGTTITFKKGLEGGEIDLVKGPIAVERAVTLDATLNGGLTIDGQGASRIFTVDTYRETSPTATVEFNGLTLVDGAANEGGFIYVGENTNFKLTNSTLTVATAPATTPTNGGAICNAGKTTLEYVDIANASATDYGGALYNAETGVLSVTSGTISGSSAANGAGLYNFGTATVAGTKFEGGEASARGGAIYNGETGTIAITKSAEITGNAAQYGGGVYNTGSATVVNSTISENTAEFNGAGFYNAGKASMTSAKILGNIANEYGGGVFDATQFFATRTVIAENVAGTNGSGLFVAGSSAVVSSLIVDNGAGAGAYAVVVDTTGELQFVGSDVVGNADQGAAVLGKAKIYNAILGDNAGYGLSVAEGATAGVQYSMVDVASTALPATNLDYAPNFADFDASKGWREWNLRPTGGSPAVAGGSLDYNYYNNFNGKKTAITVDFAGNARVTEEGIDVGAYASTTMQEDMSTIVTTFEDIVDPTDGLVSLREAIRYASNGKTVADRTVTFSPDLFSNSDSGTITLSPDLQTIIIGTTVNVTTAYTDEFGETKYRDVTVDGSESNAPLFMINGDADVEIRGMTFANGHATGDNTSGGAFIINSGTLTLLDSILTGNQAERNGGAVYQDGGVFYLIDSLVYENSANTTYGYGGAICMTGGQAYIYNTTVASNDAAVYGGVFSIDGLVVLANSIVAQNGGAQNVDVYANNLEATANLIGSMDPWRSVAGYNGNIVGTVTNPVDPLFTDAANADFTLASGSLAINSGVNAYAFGPDGVRLKYDLNANDRIIGEVVDMGAFESGFQDVPSTVVTTLADTNDQADGLISLREAIEFSQQLGTPITFDLGDDFEGGAEIRLDATKGAILVTDNLVIDASEVPGGVTIVGGDDRIFNVQGGSLTLDSVALTGGYAAKGGAIYMSSGDLNLTNVLIYGNTAEEEGGAIYAVSGNATLLNVTIAGNTAENAPGAYFGGGLALHNSIIAENAEANSTSDENYDLYVGGKFSPIASIVGVATASDRATYDGYNGNVFGDEDNVVNPGFTASGSNDYTLEQSSIAINAGSNRLVGLPGYYASILQTSANPTVLRTDFAGDPRLVGGTVDIGAYEYQTETEAPSVVVTTLEDVVDPFDGEISLREALDYAGSVYFKDGVTTTIGRTITFDPSLTNGTISLADTLEITKCVVVDASPLGGTLTVDAGGNFNAITLNGKADSVADEIYLVGLTITGGAAEYGAGVYHVDGAATMINCAVFGNNGVYGAGVASAADMIFGNEKANQLTLVNCTIAGNDATGAYAGLWSRGSSVNILNTIIAQNTTNGEAGIDIAISSVGKLTNSIIGIATNSFARTYNGLDHNIVGTANDPTDPAFNDAENNDYTLVRGEDGFMSVGVNGGDNAYVALPDGAVPAFDAGSNLRIIGTQVDIGAYESALGPVEIPSLLVTTLDDVVDAYDGLISLREATKYANNYGLGKTITFAERLKDGVIYLNSRLELSNDITIDGLAHEAEQQTNMSGIVLTLADDVDDQSVIYVNAGNTIINGLTITNRYTERVRAGGAPNVAEGGAIYVRSGSISLYNSLITDNAAKKGSAIFINSESESATVNLTNCTVVANVGQTSDENAGAAIYADKGMLGMWNTIVVSNTLANGSQAQDVYKGQMQLANDTVVERTALSIQINAYNTAVSHVFQEGEGTGYTTSLYLTSFTPLTYTGGQFVDAGGTAHTFANGEYAVVYSPKTLVYSGDEWYDNGAVYELDMQYGDTAEWFDASTGTTRTIRYTFGQFRTVSGYSIVTFGDGDQITFNEPDYYAYVDGAFYQLNVKQNSGWGSQYTLTQSALNKYTQQALASLQADLARKTTYQKTVNGVTVTYPIVSAEVGLSNVSANVVQNQSDAAYAYTTTLTLTATYDYVTRVGSTVFNCFVGSSDSLAEQVSGNGCYIGSSSLDLSPEIANLFVDPDNANYSLTDASLATNSGNNAYVNQGTINGTFDSFDVLGNKRIYYATIDMGAFENQTARDSAISSVQGTNATLTVTTYRDAVDPTDGVTSFREAIETADKMSTLGYDVTIQFASAYSVVIDNTLGVLSITNPVTILGNGATLDADNSGCALDIATDGEVVLSRLIITNGVNGDGGGIKFTKGDLVLDDCLIYNCEATAYGGGIYDSSNGTLKLYNTTVAKNASVTGNGIYGAAGSNVELYNSILADNRASTIGDLAYDVALVGNYNIYNSLIGNAGTQTYANQLLRRAVNSKIGYGLDNSVDPRFIDPSAGNFRISATDSPAKGAGSYAYVYPGATSDLGGNSISNPVSMGAYQIRTETPSLVVTTLEDISDPTDGLISLREAIAYQGRYFGDNILNGSATTGNHVIDGAAGAHSVDDSVYNVANAMVDPDVYDETYLNPITFDASLAGGTIYLTSPLVFENQGGVNYFYDYMIDASALSGLGGITIDATAITRDQMGETLQGYADGASERGNIVNGVFSIHGDANRSINQYYLTHLDIRNVKITAASYATNAFFVNQFAMLSMHNCEVSGFNYALYVWDDDSADGGLAHIYNSTIVSDCYDGGMTYYYNTAFYGYQTIRNTQANPAYRQVYAYYTAYNGWGGPGGRFHANEGTFNYGNARVNDVFVDYYNGDYRPATRSLLVNTGSNQYLNTLIPTHARAEVDVNGNARVFANTVDIGAYERPDIADVPSGVVTTSEDVVDPTDGVISIREAIAYTEQNAFNRFYNTVTFDSSVAGSTITLDGPLSLTRHVTINGGGNNVTLNGGGNGSVIDINILSPFGDNIVDVYLRNMILTGGFSTQNGGAINITSGNVYLSGLDIYGNESRRYGGAVYAYDSELTINDCRIGGNTATYYGGVVNEFGKTVMTNSYVAQNVGINANAGADIWGRAVVNYINSKNNVVGYVADNITLYDGVDGNRIGTAESPLEPFVNPNPTSGGLVVKTDFVVNAGAQLDTFFETFTEDDGDSVDVELGEELSVFDEVFFEEF